MKATGDRIAYVTSKSLSPSACDTAWPGVDYFRGTRWRQIRRINNAIDYFRKWPSLKSQKEAIRGLEDLSNMAAKECIDEFNRLLRTVGPAVQFQVCVCVFIKLHITAQSGLVILVILCHSR